MKDIGFFLYLVFVVLFSLAAIQANLTIRCKMSGLPKIDFWFFITYDCAEKLK